jgi:hypothetical protein
MVRKGVYTQLDESSDAPALIWYARWYATSLALPVGVR